eukprot:m.311233 g.311233  ORF g.311233 m.311233 type:complete len:663 (+) comp62956_c0_seq1:83-2071(+)
MAEFDPVELELLEKEICDAKDDEEEEESGAEKDEDPDHIEELDVQNEEERAEDGETKAKEEGEAMEDGGFGKLVKTLQVIRNWAKRKERPPPEPDPLLKRLKIANPNLLDEFAGDDAANGEKASSRRKSLWIINPSSEFLYRWLFLVTLALQYNLWVIIARACFSQLQSQYFPVWITLDYVCDGMYIIDMAFQFRTGYLEQGLPVKDFGKLRWHYIRTKGFWLDALSILPLDLFYIVAGTGATALRLNRLFKIHRMWLFFSKTESKISFPNVFRVTSLVLYIMICIHWNACIYFALSTAIGLGSDRWVYPLPVGNWSNLSRKYIYSLYWSTQTLTTIGETPEPATDAEYAFVIFDFLVGVLIFATIVGNVGYTISNMNAARNEFQDRMDGIKQYMHQRNVSKDMETRVIQWFDYLWTCNHSLDEQQILDTLPDKLKADIAIYAHLATLRKVDIFKDCEAGLLQDLVLKLRPQLFSPGDYVCRKNDVGKEMYIVKHGRLQVVADDETTVLATLSDGSFFGEISILNLGGVNRRTATVRSVGYSYLFSLAKRDLLEVLMEYPDAKQKLEDRGRKILIKDGLLTREEAAREESENRPRSTSPLLHPAARTAGRVDDERERVKVHDLEEEMKSLSEGLKRLRSEFNTSQMKLKQRIFQLEKASSGK